MEADSTTLDCDQKQDLRCRRQIYIQSSADEFGECELYNDILKPLFVSRDLIGLLEWMKNFNLIKSSIDCPKCMKPMIWKVSGVVDKYQWTCSSCKGKSSIREKSFFKNTLCPLDTGLNIIFAWCQDMEYTSVAQLLGVKKNIVGSMYNKIEKLIYSIPMDKILGGPESVVLVTLYPDGMVERQPDSSISDSSHKNSARILCLVDTKHNPIKYWLHVLRGHAVQKTENNNNSDRKYSLADEAMAVIERIVSPGGFVVVGGSPRLNELHRRLANSGCHQGVALLDQVVAKSSMPMLQFVTETIWRQAVTLCGASQELSRGKAGEYLAAALWRRHICPATQLYTRTLQCIAQHIGQ